MKILLPIIVAAMALPATALTLPHVKLPQAAPITVQARHTLDGKTMIDGAGKTLRQVNDDPEIATQHPKGEYISLGTGTYYEDLFTFWGADDELFWPVEIEESVDEPGWFRLQPYKGSNPITEAIGRTDDTYMYFNATDPQYVWMEDIVLYDGQYIFSQYVPENDWPYQYQFYGYYEDGIINFEDGWFNTFVYDETGQDGIWFHADNGMFKIAMPGVKIGDYRLKAISEFCCPDNEPLVSIELGADVGNVYALTAHGTMELDLDLADFVIQNGDKIPAGMGGFKVQGLGDKGRGLYTVCLVATDADDNFVNSTTAYVFIENDDAENWEPLGRGFWQEGIVSPHISGLTMTQINVDIEQHKTIQGYYRLVNPLKEHELLSPYLLPTDAHNHYIYVNATDPDFVYLEVSEIGLETANGQSAVWSYIGHMLDQGYTKEQLQGYGFAGTLQNNVISFPDDMLLYAEPRYFGGRFVTSGDRVKIYLDRTIEDVAVDTVKTDDYTPAEYFNLQGIRVSNPANGIFIRRQGDKVTKEYIR